LLGSDAVVAEKRLGLVLVDVHGAGIRSVFKTLCKHLMINVFGADGTLVLREGAEDYWHTHAKMRPQA